MHPKRALVREWAVLRFSVMELHTITPRALAVALFFTSVSIVSLIIDAKDARPWVFSIGGLGLAWGTLWPVTRWLMTTRVSVLEDHGAEALIRSVDLSGLAREQNLALERVPTGQSSDYVLRSKKLDSVLRQNDIPTEVLSKGIDRTTEHLRSNVSDPILRALRNQARKNGSLFQNESKVCLADDRFTPGRPVKIYRGTYFHGLLTNDLFVKRIESRGPRPATIASPARPDVSTGKYRLSPLHTSVMSNHFGASTIAFSDDHHIRIWRQSARSLRSPLRRVPTGSGSSKWTDYQPGATLNEIVQAVIEREIREEALEKSGANLTGVTIESRVLGYYRDMNRGGKPDFVGASRVHADWHAMTADTVEVDDPDGWDILVYPVRSLEETRESLRSLQDPQNLSIALWAAAQALLEALDENPEEWCRFLGIPYDSSRWLLLTDPDLTSRPSPPTPPPASAPGSPPAGRR